ncbi:MAG: hypothetical protein L0I76_25670 [Pseudonocardia sp.]|nr:hypothetical protein [Pseudonocardia sp.]
MLVVGVERSGGERGWTRGDPAPALRGPLALDDLPHDRHRDGDDQHQGVEDRQLLTEQQPVQPRQHGDVQRRGEHTGGGVEHGLDQRVDRAYQPVHKGLAHGQDTVDGQRHDAQQLGQRLLEEVLGRAGVAQALGSLLDLVPLATENGVVAQALGEIGEEGEDDVGGGVQSLRLVRPRGRRRRRSAADPGSELLEPPG